jgi:protein involved in polysaccharide export with SLBB domain
MSGGLKYEASLQQIEVARRIRDPYSLKPTDKAAEVFTFSIDDKLSISPEAKRFALAPYDEVYVRISPGYEKQRNVTVRGEVVFRGDYVLSNKSQRLSEVITKAGGLTPQAYKKGARLLRKMTHDDSVRVISLIKLAARSSSKKDTIDIKKLDIGSEYFVGIDLEKAMSNPESEYDVVLKEDDVVEVPQFSNTVRISGAVLYPNTVTFRKNMNLSDYVSMAGGYDDGAKKRKAFVIYMNGTAARKRFWSSPRIEPGCEIVVPAKPERKGATAGEILGYSSSLASIAAMIATIISVTK